MMNTIKAVIVWLARIFTEADGNGGKPSYARVLGAFVVWRIIVYVEMHPAGTQAPEIYETMFWVLIGYQLLSKTLNSMSPAVLAIAQSMLARAGVPIKPADEKPQAQ